MYVGWMASDPSFNPYEAGPKLSGTPVGPASGPSAPSVSVLLDGVLVEEPDGGWGPDAIVVVEGAGAPAGAPAPIGMYRRTPYLPARH